MTVSYSGNFTRLLLRWKGSIWRSVWKELLLFLFLYFSIRFTSPYIIKRFDPDSSRKFGSRYSKLCAEFDDYTKQIPLTFLLGFYVSNIVSRWWRQFECLSWPEDVLSCLCLVLPLPESRQVRHQVARYVNLTAALAWRDISSKIRLRFPTVRSLIDVGLLTEKEYIILESLNETSPGIRWLAPLHWAQQLISDEIATGRGQQHFVSTLTNQLKSLRESFRRLFCYDWLVTPLVYSQVAALSTYSYFAFCLLGRQHRDGQIDTYVPIYTVVQFLCYIGWLKVGQDLLRPFGLDDDDIELSFILDRNLTLSFSIVNSLQDSKPPPFEEDVFWQYLETKRIEEGSSLIWGRIDLSRNAHKHPPKLHVYHELRGLEDDKVLEKSKRESKLLNW